MPAAEPPPSRGRRALVALAVLVALAAGGVTARNLSRGDRPPPVDFAAFWAAGDLNLRGQNPYDAKAVRGVQRGIGLDADTAVMMYNPPWLLSVVMPFAALPVGPAYGLWALAQIALVLLAAELLWRAFAPADPARRAGHARRRWVAYLIALTFVPTTYLVGIGQTTAVVLAAVAGYAALDRAGRPVLAGASAALAAAKPHLLTVFAVWLLLEAARTRFGRRVVLGGLLVGAAACAPPTLANPGVWGQYWHAITAPSDEDHVAVANWAAPVVGAWLRAAVPGRPFWVQFVPAAVAIGLFAVWHTWRGGTGDAAGRRAALPWVVGVSLLVAPYGAWAFDLVLLLVPVLAAAARTADTPRPAAVWLGAGGLLVVNAVLLVMMLRVVSSERYVWAAPTVLLGALAVWHLAGRRPVAGPDALGAPA